MTKFDILLEEAFNAGYARAWGGSKTTLSFKEWRETLGDRS